MAVLSLLRQIAFSLHRAEFVAQRNLAALVAIDGLAADAGFYLS